MEIVLDPEKIIGRIPSRRIDLTRDSKQAKDVYNIGMSIGANEEADLKTLKAALLYLYSGESAKDSAKVAEWDLRNVYSKDEIEKISNAILSDPISESPSKPETLEAKVLQDTVKLSYIGDPGYRLAVSMMTRKCWNKKKIGKWYLDKLVKLMNNGFFHTNKATEGYMDKLNFSLKFCQVYLGEDVRSILEKNLTLEALESWLPTA